MRATAVSTVRHHPWRDRNRPPPPRSGPRSPSPSSPLEGSQRVGTQQLGVSQQPVRHHPWRDRNTYRGYYEAARILKSVITPGGIATLSPMPTTTRRPEPVHHHPWRDHNPLADCAARGWRSCPSSPLDGSQRPGPRHADRTGRREQPRQRQREHAGGPPGRRDSEQPRRPCRELDSDDGFSAPETSTMSSSRYRGPRGGHRRQRAVTAQAATGHAVVEAAAGPPERPVGPRRAGAVQDGQL